MKNSTLFKEYSRNEILQHNQIDDCWIVLFNKVYDITNFLDKHPGGAEILMTRAGEDATSFFQTRHGVTSSRELKHLEKYQIGVLSQNEQIEEAAFDEPFFDELIKTCKKKNLYQVSKEKSNHFNRVRTALLLVNLMTIIGVFYLKINLWMALPMVILQAMVSCSLFGLIAHEHTHREFPENKILHGLLVFMWPILWPFISRKALIYEHNSHHVKIGDPEYDYEVIGFSHFIRYSGMIEYKGIHRLQHKVSFLWYMFYANIITTVGGIYTAYWESHNKKVALKHNISLLLTFTFYIIIPAIIHGSLFYFLGWYLLFQCLLFTFIYLGSAINHFIPMASQPIPKDMRNKYGYYVCHNSSNFAPHSTFWFYFTGGFNIQVEHHLNAFVPVENLRDLKVVVENLCKKYNYPYIEYESLSTLQRAHYDYLLTMSNSELSTEIQQEVDNKRFFQAR
ncbi:MAG: fatty acid desaturase [Chitinophagales bacterium]|nr:fatty acid desaturase [Chitinophagales bacterium]